jgi:GAF domain-containing protein
MSEHEVSGPDNILRLSTDLQSVLIRELAVAVEFGDLTDRLLEIIIEKAQERIRASSCSIIILDDPKDLDKERSATVRAGTAYNKENVGKISYKVLHPEDVPEKPKKTEKLGLAGWVISTGNAFLSSTHKDVHDHPHHLGKGVPGKGKLAAYLAVPLRNPRGKIIGAFKAERLEGKPFSVFEQMLLETLAQLTGRCIAHVEDAWDDRNAAITAWVLNVISEAVSEEGEMDAFLDIVVHVMTAAALADSCSVFLIDVNKRTLTQRAGCGAQMLKEVIRSYKLPDPEQVKKLDDDDGKKSKEKKVGLTAWIASTGKSFYAANFRELRKHRHHRGAYDKQNYTKKQQCGAFFGVPLRVGGTVIGVLKIENVSLKTEKDEPGFSKEIQSRVVTLAQSIALAIERLQHQSPARYRIILEAKKTIFDVQGGDLNVSDLVNQIVRETMDLFDARSCALFLKEGNQLIQPPWAAEGYAKKEPPVRRYDLVKPEKIKDNPAPNEKVGLTVWIAVKREKFTAKSNLELKAHPHWKGSYDADNFDEEKSERCETFMGVPLVVRGELLGVLKVETKMKKVGDKMEFAYFSEQDELVLELIANSAAIAITNARLMESRVLADKILSLPDTNAVVGELYLFIQDRAEVINTLDSTTEIVGQKNKKRAEVIEAFTGLLLNPERFPDILEELAAMVEKHLKNLLEFTVQSVRVESLTDIRNLPKKKITQLLLHREEFFLHQCAKILLNSWEWINKQLIRFKENNTLKTTLQSCLEIIEENGKSIEKSNLFEKNLLERIFTRWEEVIEKAFSQFHKIPNPYIAGLPLPPESPLFVGRKDIFDWVEEKLSEGKSYVLVLHGGSRSGKTSILMQLQAGPLGEKIRNRRINPIFPVFIDLHKSGDRGTDNFLYRFAKIIAADLQKQGVPISRPEKETFNTAYYDAFDDFLNLVTLQLKERSDGILTIMLDEFETLGELVDSKKVDADIFKFFRSQMQHQPSITYILAGHHRLDDLKPIYKNLIFTVSDHKRVGVLSEADAEKLVREPVRELGVSYNDNIVEKILKTTNRNPYFIQQLCTFCMDALNREKKGYTITESYLQEAIDKSLEPESTATLEVLWESVGHDGQSVLKKMCQLVEEDKEWVNEKEIAADLSNEIADTAQIYGALERLKKHQMILEDRSTDNKCTNYRFAMDLMRLYIVNSKLQRK